MIRRPPRSTLFPTRRSSDLRAHQRVLVGQERHDRGPAAPVEEPEPGRPSEDCERHGGDRKSTRLNSSHGYISYAVLCLKKTTKIANPITRLLTAPSIAALPS